MRTHRPRASSSSRPSSRHDPQVVVASDSGPSPSSWKDPVATAGLVRDVVHHRLLRITTTKSCASGMAVLARAWSSVPSVKHTPRPVARSRFHAGVTPQSARCPGQSLEVEVDVLGPVVAGQLVLYRRLGTGVQPGFRIGNLDPRPEPRVRCLPEVGVARALAQAQFEHLPEASGDWARLVIGEPPSQGTVGMNLK